jgi:NAD(P)-dependent dehydrogenase (short-subunit alcohol dehydrogenase family)
MDLGSFDLARGAVLVTGAGSGIGRACAERLHRGGFTVFAGVRRATALERGLVPLTLDVTDDGAVVAAAAAIRDQLGGEPLVGVVNSAGVSGGGPAELTPPEEVRQVLETNFTGTFAVTRELLPLLRASRGRVVCIGSIGGRVPAPFLAPYSASKAAVAALCDCLRVELRPWGIQVVLVEPGSIATPMWGKGLEDLDRGASSGPAEARALYAPYVRAVRGAAARTAARGAPPDTVARVVERALTARRPRPRYLVGWDARLQASLRLLPVRARDRVMARALGLPRGGE